MNAILQYLDSIASALEGMASGKTATKSSSTAKSASAASASSSIAASGVIEAPGVAEALDSALFTTVMQDEEEQRVSAVKKLFDDIRAELVSALFQESNGVYTSYLAQIHTQLSSFNIASTLAGLTDTDISTPDDGHVLMYYSTSQGQGIWANITRQYLLQLAMIDTAGGGNNSIGSSSKPIYWDGTTHTFKAFDNNIQAAAYKYVTTQFVQGYITDNYLPTASAVYNYVGKLWDYDAVTSTAIGCVTGQALHKYVAQYLGNFKGKGLATEAIQYGSGGSDIATAGGVYAYVTGMITDDKTKITSGGTKLPTAGAIYDFVMENGGRITSFGWNQGTQYGPTPQIVIGESAVQNVTAIPSASSQYSGIVTTGQQSFAGAKTFDANLATGGTFTAASSITSTAGNITATAGNVVATAGHILATAGRIDGRMLVVPTDAPSSYETGKWYVHINPNAISGSSPS